MLRRVLTIFLGVAMPGLSLSSPVAGQRWWVDAGAGAATHEALASRTTTGLNLGVRSASPLWSYLAGGLPLDGEGLPWLSLGSGGRASTGTRLQVGVDAEAHGHLFRSSEQAAAGGGGLVGLIPFVATDVAGVALELYSGIQHYSSTFLERTSKQTLHSSGIRGGIPLPSGIDAGVDTRYVRTSGETFLYSGVSGAWHGDRGAAWASGGKWLDSRIPTPVWEIGASIEAGRRARVTAVHRQETNDPLYWNEPRRSWNLSLSYALGRAPARVGGILPEVVGDRVLIRILVGESREPPFVAGDFTGWSELPMRREGGFWVADLVVSPGVYRYSFRRADGTWFVPASIPNRVDDGFGGENAVLVVS